MTRGQTISLPFSWETLSYFHTGDYYLMTDCAVCVALRLDSDQSPPSGADYIVQYGLLPSANYTQPNTT